MKKKILSAVLLLFMTIAAFAEDCRGIWVCEDFDKNEVEFFLDEDGYIDLKVRKEWVQIHSEYEGDYEIRDFAGWNGSYTVKGSYIVFHVEKFYEFLEEENGILGYAVESDVEISFEIIGDAMTVSAPFSEVLPFSSEEVYDFPLPLVLRKK